MRTRRAAIPLILLVALAAAPGASARLVDAGSGSAHSDGRYFWYQQYPDGQFKPDASWRLIDTRKGTEQTVQTPAGCTSSLKPSIRRALIACPSEASYRLLDLDTGTATPLDLGGCKAPSGGPAADPSYGQITWVLLGRHWIQGYYEAGDNGRGTKLRPPIFFNWRSGACRSFPNTSEGWRDNDDPALPKRKSPRCGRRGVAFTVTDGSGGRGDPILMRLCKERRTARLHCSDYCEFGTAANGFAVWTQGQRVRARNLRSGRGASWRFTDHDRNAGFSSVFTYVAGNTLFVQAAQPESGIWHLHAVDLPE